MTYGFLVIVACLASWVVNLCIVRMSTSIGFTDSPDGCRKLQTSSVPLGGGLGILLAMIGTALGVMLFDLPGASAILAQPLFNLGFFAAIALICIVGLLDDLVDIRGRQKLFAQVVIVFLVSSSGLAIHQIRIFGHLLELGVFAIPFTMCWLLAAINALNFVDGIDGLAGTLAVILGTTTAILAGMTNHANDAMLAAILTGAVLGFLIHNLPPAKIYMGDAGSMLIGLALGTLAIRASLKGPATVALVTPIAIWAILFLDVAMAVFRRKLTGRSVYASDRLHFHHVLLGHGFSIPMVLLILGTLNGLCAIGGLASVLLNRDSVALVTILTVFSIVVVSGIFGRWECDLVVRRLHNLGVSLCRLPSKREHTNQEFCSRLEGDKEWEVIWQSLVEYADRFDLIQLHLNVSIPGTGEEYHASWSRKAQPPQDFLWNAEVPLFNASTGIGTLSVSGAATDGSVVIGMSELIEGLKPVEVQLEGLFYDDGESEIDMDKSQGELRAIA